MNNLKTQIHKEFDDKFCTAFGKKVYVQRNGVEHQQEVVEYSADKIKSFIDQSIDKAIAEERKEIIDWLQKRCLDNIKAFGTDKWNSDMEELLEKLTVDKPIEESTK